MARGCEEVKEWEKSTKREEAKKVWIATPFDQADDEGKNSSGDPKGDQRGDRSDDWSVGNQRGDQSVGDQRDDLGWDLSRNGNGSTGDKLREEDGKTS
jgi:hypothetical protein